MRSQLQRPPGAGQPVTMNYKSSNVLPFIYQVTLALTALGNGSVNLTLEASSEFELHYMMASTDQDQVQSATIAAQYPNNFTCQITDQSSGRQLSSGKVPQRIMFGPANRNLEAARPVVFPPNAILQFDMTNLVNGTTNVTVGLVGYKIFPGK